MSNQARPYEPLTADNAALVIRGLRGQATPRGALSPIKVA